MIKKFYCNLVLISHGQLLARYVYETLVSFLLQVDNMDDLNEDQNEVFNLIKRGCNILLTGSGGTGKSFTIEKTCEHFESEGKTNINICAKRRSCL